MAKNDIDPLDYRYYQLTTFFNRYLFFGHDFECPGHCGLGENNTIHCSANICELVQFVLTEFTRKDKLETRFAILSTFYQSSHTQDFVNWSQLSVN